MVDKDDFTRIALTFTALEQIAGYFSYVRTLNQEKAPEIIEGLDAVEQAFAPLLEYAKLQYEAATAEELRPKFQDETYPSERR